ncbi:hypothetical protein [Streptomyces sp. MBT84]|uniref:hypothetical protein n=1 Tax=Streptomyces sp. MBT84 TaxID=1488414 RepID=UPI0035AC1549
MATYHPGGAGLTAPDLGKAEAIAGARSSLPATGTVPTTRGEHWLYQGNVQAANAVRPGVDIKSSMPYAGGWAVTTGRHSPCDSPGCVRAEAPRSAWLRSA